VYFGLPCRHQVIIFTQRLCEFNHLFFNKRWEQAIEPEENKNQDEFNDPDDLEADSLSKQVPFLELNEISKKN